MGPLEADRKLVGHELRSDPRLQSRVETVTDANGNRTTCEYDGHDRLGNTRYPSPTTAGTSAPTSGAGADFERLSYDAAGNVASRRTRAGQTIGYGYDNLGRVIARDLPGSELTVSYSYDLLGRMLTAVTSAQTLMFGYDALGRLTSEPAVMGSFTYGYDAAGRRISMTWPGSNTLVVGYSYDMAGEVTEIRENPSGGNSLLASYGYDDLGRRTSLTRGNGAVTSYGYDNVSRLSQIVQNVSGTSYDLTLDLSYTPAGQIAATTRSNDAYAWGGHYAVNRNYSANGLNQYTASGAITPTYDANGNLTSMESGSFDYDSENRLAHGPGGAELAYDTLGRLFFTYSGATGVSYLASSGDTIGAEFDGSLAIRRRYVFGPDGEPLAWYEGSGTSTRRFFHADERGSIVAVTDGSGAMLAINSYDEHGIPATSNSGRFQYTGQAWLPELGMYHYRARAYSPSLGRFMQTDPIGFGGGMNLYGYVGNDPVNLTDPSGLDPPGRYEACTGSRLCVHAQNGGFNGTYPAVGASVASMAGPNGEMRDVTSYYQDGQLIDRTYGPWIPIPGFARGGAFGTGASEGRGLICFVRTCSQRSLTEEEVGVFTRLGIPVEVLTNVRLMNGLPPGPWLSRGFQGYTLYNHIYLRFGIGPFLGSPARTGLVGEEIFHTWQYAQGATPAQFAYYQLRYGHDQSPLEIPAMQFNARAVACRRAGTC